MFRRGLRVSDAALWHCQCQISEFRRYAAQDVHCDKLHTLEGECSIDQHGQEREEATEANFVCRHEGGLCHYTGVLPVAEANAFVVRSSSKVDNETRDDKTGNQQNCRRSEL